MNWANRLTLGRLVLTIVFVISLSSSWRYGRTVALLLFVLAGVTDYFDGEIARRYSIVTNFGKLMDPLIDKVMMAAGFICLVPLKAIPAWAAIIVVARDFLITGLRLLASAKGEILPAEQLGKHKTTWQITTVLFFLTLLSLQELRYADGADAWWLRAWNQGGAILVTVAVAFTLISASAYAWRHRAIVAANQ